MIVVQRCHRGAREGPPGVPTPDTISTRSVHGKRHSAVGCSQLPSPGSVKCLLGRISPGRMSASVDVGRKDEVISVD